MYRVRLLQLCKTCIVSSITFLQLIKSIDVNKLRLHAKACAECIAINKNKKKSNYYTTTYMYTITRRTILVTAYNSHTCARYDTCVCTWQSRKSTPHMINIPYYISAHLLSSRAAHMHMSGPKKAEHIYSWKQNFNISHQYAMTHPTTLAAIQPAHAVQLLRKPPQLQILDARHPKLHTFERIKRSHSAKTAPAPPPNTTVLVYDAGAISLTHTFTLAVRTLSHLLTSHPVGLHLRLISGGLPALRHLAPDLIETGNLTSLRPIFSSIPWANSTLDNFQAETIPPAPVLPWLFLGSAAHNTPVFRRTNNITRLILAANELSLPTSPHLSALHIPAEDHSQFPLHFYFPSAVAFLEAARAAGAACLVYCLAGASRSVAIVAAYLIYTGMSLSEALSLLSATRSASHPNPAFVQHLKAWEASFLPNSNSKSIPLSPVSPHASSPNSPLLVLSPPALPPSTE